MGVPVLKKKGAELREMTEAAMDRWKKRFDGASREKSRQRADRGGKVGG
jgi:hypothetical protein